MCKIVSIFSYCILKACKKTNNLMYIAQSYTLLYILTIRLRLKNVYLYAMGIVEIGVLFLLEI